MLLGIWKNIEELEENINLPELELLVEAGREREHQRFKVMAALKGINIDSPNGKSVKERFDEIKMRAEARTSGRSQEELEFDALGIDVEIE